MKAEAASIRLYVADGKLRARGSTELSPELRAELTSHRSELIALLSKPKRTFKEESEDFLEQCRKFWPGAKIVNQRLY
jgi:hypothetical protein